VADVTEEQRQAAIEQMKLAFAQVGMPEDVAAELAESSVDEAIRRGAYK
jgi:truncated hemoglobin YjbI